MVTRSGSDSNNMRAPLRNAGSRQESLEQADHRLDVGGRRELARAVHAEHRVADVDGANAEPRRADGPDGAPAAEIAAHHEALRLRLRLDRELLRERPRLAVGAVALVGVELDHRSLPEQRSVAGLVAVRVV